MIVCIAEKPSVAREIAHVLGANQSCQGYMEGNGYQVTWTYGHLCCLKEPHDYTPNWKPWTLGALPMIPPRFGIKVMAAPSVQKQFKIVEQLMQHADRIINCGDAGQEGELIQRWVIQSTGARCPVQRLWVSSLTEEAIREGFANLKDAAEYQSLYEAGLSRAIGDWLLGMNATRLYTLKYGQDRQVLSIGRVQTPTLALIVNRYWEITNFKPQQYWVLSTLYRGVTFTATQGKYESEEKGQEDLQNIVGKSFTVTDITTKKGKEAPPRLFDLTSLQVECNKKYSFSADQTLQLSETDSTESMRRCTSLALPWHRSYSAFSFLYCVARLLSGTRITSMNSSSALLNCSLASVWESRASLTRSTMMSRLWTPNFSMVP